MPEDESEGEKNITGFFKQLDVDGIGSGNVEKVNKLIEEKNGGSKHSEREREKRRRRER